MEKHGYHFSTFLRPLIVRVGKSEIQTFNWDESSILAIFPTKVWISIKFGFWSTMISITAAERPLFLLPTVGQHFPTNEREEETTV